MNEVLKIEDDGADISDVRKERRGQHALKPIADQIPDLLKRLDQWLVWGDGAPANEKGKLSKVPYSARTGSKCGPTSPAAWSSFEAAWAAYETGKYSGIGFALSGHPVGKNTAGKSLFLHGFDFDEALLTSEVGTQYAPAMRIPELRELFDHTYTEISPSGIGLRMFALSTKPPSPGRNSAHVEYYTQGRFLTVTGHAVADERIEEIDADAIDRFIAGWLSPNRLGSQQPLTLVSPQENVLGLGPIPLHLRGFREDESTRALATDNIYLESRDNVDRLKEALRWLDPDMIEPHFFRVTKGLWHLERICNWETAKDIARDWAAGRLWSAPSLKYGLDSAGNQLDTFQADLQFEKNWSRLTFNSSANITEATIFDMAKRAGYATHTNSRAVLESLLSLNRGLIDTSDTLSPRPPYVIGTFAAEGKVTVLAGLGGVSKTMLTMHLAAAVSLGTRFGNLDVSEGAAMLLLGEEDSADINRRFKAILEGHDAIARAKVAERVRAFPLAGEDMRFTRLRDGNTQRTEMVSSLIDAAKELERRTGCPIKLIVIDHVRLAMAGDPNAADHATELTGALTQVATATKAAVMVLAHSPKSSIQSRGNEKEADASDIAGSGAFVNNARSAEVLVAMNENEAKTYGLDPKSRHEYVKLVIVKNNIGKTGDEYWYRRAARPRHDVAVLEPVNLASHIASRPDLGSSLKKRIVDMIRVNNGQLTANALRQYATKKGKLGASQGEVTLALDALVTENVIKKVTIDRANRGKRTARVGTVVLEVASGCPPTVV